MKGKTKGSSALGGTAAVWGLILTLVFGLALAGCNFEEDSAPNLPGDTTGDTTGDLGGDLPEPRGKLTITGLEEYNNYYINAQADLSQTALLKGMSREGKSIRISDGQAVIPLYKMTLSAEGEPQGGLAAYTGNDQNVSVTLLVYSSATAYNNPDDFKQVTVNFVNGNATAVFDPGIGEPGKLTITGLWDYNGNYITMQSLEGMVLLSSATDDAPARILISEEKADIPLYHAIYYNDENDEWVKEVYAYTGNDRIRIKLCIYSTDVSDGEDGPLETREITVTFSSGNATAAWPTSSGGGAGKPTPLASTASFNDGVAKLDEIIAYCEANPSGNTVAKMLSEQDKLTMSEAGWSQMSSMYIDSINGRIANLE